MFLPPSFLELFLPFRWCIFLDVVEFYMDSPRLTENRHGIATQVTTSVRRIAQNGAQLGVHRSASIRWYVKAVAQPLDYLNSRVTFR